ncbi:MAG: response regulator [Pseudomonadota bacterium]
MHRVLIAEDDAILLRRLEKAFEAYPKQVAVIGAANGQEAIDALEKQAIALLITDIQMPEVDGLELLAHVNSHYPVVRCFVMTAYDSEDLQKELPRDLLRFFRKPLDPADVAKAAMAVLNRDVPRGVVKGISVASFLFMISLEKKTCLLEVRGAGDKKGLLYIEDGEPFDASFHGLKGEAAAIEIINLTDAAFHFKNFPDRPVARRISTSIQDMITAARARQEELAGIDWDDIIS